MGGILQSLRVLIITKLILASCILFSSSRYSADDINLKEFSKHPLSLDIASLCNHIDQNDQISVISVYKSVFDTKKLSKEEEKYGISIKGLISWEDEKQYNFILSCETDSERISFKAVAIGSDSLSLSLKEKKKLSEFVRCLFDEWEHNFYNKQKGKK